MESVIWEHDWLLPKNRVTPALILVGTVLVGHPWTLSTTRAWSTYPLPCPKQTAHRGQVGSDGALSRWSWLQAMSL